MVPFGAQESLARGACVTTVTSLSTRMRATAPRSIKEDRPAEMRYEISAAILEIYNEAVVDLLAPGGKAELELARSGGGFDLPDLTCVGALPYPSAACQPRSSSCHGSGWPCPRWRA
jgi:hypothetical protein